MMLSSQQTLTFGYQPELAQCHAAAQPAGIDLRRLLRPELGECHAPEWPAEINLWLQVQPELVWFDVPCSLQTLTFGDFCDRSLHEFTLLPGLQT